MFLKMVAVTSISHVSASAIQLNIISLSVLGMEIVLVCFLTPTQKQTSETRTHMQAVYLGDDPRKYY